MVEPAAAHVLALLPAVLGRLGEELVVDVVVLLQRALLRLEGSKKEIKREKEMSYLVPNDARRAALEVVAHQRLLIVAGVEIL